MSGDITDAWGNKKEAHECAPRSEFAKAYTKIIAIESGVWNIILDELPCGIAIKFCPFCGKTL